MDLKKAKHLIETRRQEYHESRPPWFIGKQTPEAPVTERSVRTTLASHIFK
jgi:hypothetical protein